MSLPLRSSPLAAVARFIYWAGPSLLLMAGMWFVGGDTGSGRTTGSILESLLGTVWPWLATRLAGPPMEMLNFLLRKGGHFWGYALLCACNIRALRGLSAGPARGPLPARVRWGPAQLGLLLSVLWACADEAHQSFSPSRSASIGDVLLDTAGAAAGAMIVSLWHHHRSRLLSSSDPVTPPSIATPIP